jgi:hypothetical protein
MSRSNEEVALVWKLKITRLVASKHYQEANTNIGAFFNFADHHGFIRLRYEVELLQVRISIELGDFSSAMI